MPETDLYKVLGVSKSASPEEIKKAYHRLSRKFHPDVNQDDPKAEEKFKEIQNAFDTLGDEEKRKQYDTYGRTFPNGMPFPGGGGGGSGPFPGGSPIDIESLFGGQFDLNDLLGGGGSRSGAGRSRKPRKGSDIQSQIEIPFRVAVEGGSYELQLDRGGKVERLSVKIPAGVDEGAVIRLTGQGEPGPGGGTAGDLLITIRVSSDPIFRRDGNDISIDLPLSIAEAVLGTKVSVPTIHEGEVTLTIPPRTSSGMKLRMRGKGVPDRKTGNRGDQYVVVKIVVPKVIDETAESAIRKFDDSTHFDPRQGLW